MNDDNIENKKHTESTESRENQVDYKHTLIERVEMCKSIRNYNWKLLLQDDYLVQHLMRSINITDILARILINRKIKDKEGAISFLDPKLKDLIVDPFILKDMEKATNRIYQAILNKDDMMIFADYDVDGATSSSIISKFLKSINVATSIYVPNRMNEGYGPNIEAFRKMANNGIKLVITVDCGTVAFEQVNDANEIGLDVIIVDHHIPDQSGLPKALAVINPNRFDDEFPYKNIAAVGVAFFLIIGIRKKLRDEGWFEKNNIEEPDLMNLIDLVALGSVCDVMPLININRAFVKNGMKILAKRTNVGLAILSDILHLNGKLQNHHLGFVFGPRINAGGRVGEGYLGVQLLTTDDEVEAYKIAKRLEILNNERKALESIAMANAIHQVEESNVEKQAIIIVIGENWHIGILGIMASRIKDKYHKPAVILSIIENNIVKGSARSIEGIDVGKAISIAKEMGILIDGGGHAMAGGFSLHKDKIIELCNFFNKKFEHLLVEGTIFKDAKNIEIDAILDINAINYKLLHELNKAGPFGHGNPQPKFLINNVLLTKAMIVGGVHVMGFVTNQYNKKQYYEDKQAINIKKYYSTSLKIIAFKGMENEIGEFLINKQGSIINIVGTLQINNLDNNKVEIVVEDLSIGD